MGSIIVPIILDPCLSSFSLYMCQNVQQLLFMESNTLRYFLNLGRACLFVFNIKSIYCVFAKRKSNSEMNMPRAGGKVNSRLLCSEFHTRMKRVNSKCSSSNYPRITRFIRFIRVWCEERESNSVCLSEGATVTKGGGAYQQQQTHWLIKRN